MTLIITTTSHGDVESGFYASFTQLFRLDHYTFTTRGFCEMAQSLARDPHKLEERILTYDLEKFERRFEEHLGRLGQAGSRDFYEESIGLVPRNLPEQLKKEEGEAPIEDEANLLGEGRVIDVRVRPDGKLITIGEYSIDDHNFGPAAWYASNGGHFGWGHKKPYYAEELIKAIRESEHPLFQTLQRSLQGANQKKQKGN